ncbi:MAG: hypothetical protein WB767_15965 [Nocardioides sp.]
MPTVGPDRALCVTGVLLLAASLLSACADGPDPVGAAPPAATGAASSIDPSIVEGIPIPPDLVRAFSDLLDRRSAAVLTGDRASFLADVDARPDGFVATQEGYFDNLTQLPFVEFRYDLDRASLVRGGSGGYWVVVALTQQLAGFDAAPVRTLDRFRFSPVPNPAGESEQYALSSVTDREWERTHAVLEQPWDERPIEVRTGAGVLGVFDAGSVRRARPLIRSIERGISDVSVRVPYSWPQNVVVYALSDVTFLDRLDDLPGDDAETLDAVAFTVPTGSVVNGRDEIAATRIVLNPRVLTSESAARDRLVRHELTHVAVGERDDVAPLWLGEGLAEWVSVQALAPQDRQVSDAALRSVERGVPSMPGNEEFNDDDYEVHYALAWWTCEYLAATYGPEAPWLLLDALATPEADVRQVVNDLLQLNVDQLARRGAKLMITTYDPGFLQPAPATPTQSP